MRREMPKNKTFFIRQAIEKGKNVSEITKSLKTTPGYVKTIKSYLKNGLSGYYYQKRYRSRNPGVKNKHRKKNYDQGAIYDFRSRETYPDQEKELILKFPGTDRELAKILERSVRAIQVKRVRIRRESGLIVENVFKSAVK